MRACNRWRVDPWREWAKLDLQKRIDMINYELIAEHDEAESKRAMAELFKGN